jgi:histone deacetylase complex regulatory component SIN3
MKRAINHHTHQFIRVICDSRAIFNPEERVQRVFWKTAKLSLCIKYARIKKLIVRAGNDRQIHTHVCSYRLVRYKSDVFITWTISHPATRSTPSVMSRGFFFRDNEIFFHLQYQT